MTLHVLSPGDIREAAEEITFFLANRISKNLSLRRVKESKKDKVQQAKDQSKANIKIVKKYLDLLPDFRNNPQKLEQFLLDARSLPNPTRQQLIDLAARTFDDSTTQHAALACAEEIFTHEGAQPVLIDNLKSAQALLMESRGTEIRAGYNIAHEAFDASQKGLGEAKELTDLYRKAVIEHKGLTNFFNVIRDQFPTGRLQEGIAYMIRSGASDLEAQDSSIEKNHLRNIMNDFREAKAIGQIDEAFAKELPKIDKAFGTTAQMSSEAVTYTLLGYTNEQWIQSTKISQLADNVGYTDSNIQAKIAFLTTARKEMRLLPLACYAQSDTRDDLLTAAAEAIDNAITIEETQSEEKGQRG